MYGQLNEGQKPLDEIEAGDMVIVFGRGSRSIRKVERVTKTQIVLNQYSKFRKADGRTVGAGAWDFNHIEHATPDMIERLRESIAHAKLIGEVRKLADNARYKLMDVEKLNALKELLTEKEDN